MAENQHAFIRVEYSLEQFAESISNLRIIANEERVINALSSLIISYYNGICFDSTPQHLADIWSAADGNERSAEWLASLTIEVAEAETTDEEISAANLEVDQEIHPEADDVETDNESDEEVEIYYLPYITYDNPDINNLMNSLTSLTSPKYDFFSVNLPNVDMKSEAYYINIYSPGNNPLDIMSINFIPSETIQQLFKDIAGVIYDWFLVKLI